MEYSYSRIALSNKNEQTAKINKKDESQKHCIKGKKPDSNGYILCDLFYDILQRAKLWK